MPIYERRHEGGVVASVRQLTTGGYIAEVLDRQGHLVRVPSLMRPTLEEAKDRADDIVTTYTTHRCGSRCRGWARTN